MSRHFESNEYLLGSEWPGELKESQSEMNRFRTKVPEQAEGRRHCFLLSPIRRMPTEILFIICQKNELSPRNMPPAIASSVGKERGRSDGTRRVLYQTTNTDRAELGQKVWGRMDLLKSTLHKRIIYDRVSLVCEKGR
ncbi:hypothetical protein WG66_011750 [Moniliophthora roreri]|nr:hypothetical protein WG66_011750 [Moniliophthora roreri]